MLKIYFSFIHLLPSIEATHAKLLTLPLPLQQKITAYKNPWDRILQLSSKLLLRELIHQFGLDKKIGLDNILLSKNNKPYFNNALYFSTARSGKIVVCAACTIGDVGIDIEEIKPIDVSIYEGYFTTDEWKEINTGDNTMNKFFNAWTRKEAVLKATGNGIHENFTSLEVLKNTVSFKNINYYLQEIPVAEGYVCHVASTIPNLIAEITAVKLFEE